MKTRKVKADKKMRSEDGLKVKEEEKRERPD